VSGQTDNSWSLGKQLSAGAAKSLQAKNRVFRTIERFWLQSERGALIINAPQTTDTYFTVTAEP
jgi:hypothetical protein